MRTLTHDGHTFTIGTESTCAIIVSPKRYSLTDEALLNYLLANAYIVNNFDKRYIVGEVYSVSIVPRTLSHPPYIAYAHIDARGTWRIHESDTEIDGLVRISEAAPKVAVEPITYSHEAELEDGSRIAYVAAERISGWLAHDNGKTLYSFYGTLSDCLNAENTVKAWHYSARFHNFEEEVIERWLRTGADPSPHGSTVLVDTDTLIEAIKALDDADGSSVRTQQVLTALRRSFK